MDNSSQILAKLAQAEELLAEIRTLLSAEPNQASSEASASAEVPESERELIAALFQIALTPPEEEQLLEQLSPLLHMDLRENEYALSSMLRYNWNHLLQSVETYLTIPNNPYSFEIVREKERTFTNVTEKKVYIKASNRNPVPLNLRKDPSQNDSWRIYSISL